MKRFFILAFGIMISAGLGVAASRFTMAFTTTETVTDRIFSEAGVGQPTDSSDPAVLEDLASSSDFAFQNLYVYMYNNVLNGPEAAAVKLLSKRYIDGLNFTEDELKAITQSADTTAILSQQKQRASDAQSTETVQADEDRQAAYDAEFEQFIADNSDLSETALDAIQGAYETQRLTVPSQEDINNNLDQTVVATTYTDIMTEYNKELDLQRDNRKLAYESLASEMFLYNDLSDSAYIELLYDLELAH